jgi:drug/metabolite transporter (DMT)-like permease
MPALPMHPVVIHLPLALAALMPFIFLVLLWAIRSQRLPPRVWTLALLLQGVLVLGAVAALITGDADEERAERMASEARIEDHARAAQVFTGASVAVLVAALAAGWTRRKPGVFAATGAATVLLGVAALGLAIQTGHRGGLLVYGDQASAGAAGATPSADRGSGAEPEGEAADDD